MTFPPWLMKAAGRILGELVGRPFLLRPHLWLAAAAGYLIAAIALFAYSLQASLEATLLAALWAYLAYRCQRLRAGFKPRVYVATFASVSKAGKDLAPTHQRALVARLKATFGDQVDVRSLAVPIERRTALHIRETLKALLVIYGELDVAGAHSTFDMRMTYADAPDDVTLAQQRHSMIINQRKLRWSERLRFRSIANVEAEPLSAFGVPIESFVASPSEMACFEAAVKSTRLLLDEHRLAQADAGHPTHLDLSYGYGGLPDELAARLAALECWARHAVDEVPPAGLLAWAVELAAEGLGGRHLWIWVQVQAFTGREEGWQTAAEVLCVAEAAVAAFPEDCHLQYNLAQARLVHGDFAGAAEQAARARELGAPNDLIFYLDGSIDFNCGRYAEALAIYSRCQPSARRSQYMGDCLNALGESGKALAYYREALRKQPFRRDALHCARKISDLDSVGTVSGAGLWRTISIPGLRGVTIPLADWVLSWKERKRGEQAGLHEARAFVAALRGDFVRAERYASFAVEEGGRSNVAALVALYLALAATNYYAEAVDVLSELRAHLDWLKSRGLLPVASEELSQVMEMLAPKHRRRTKGDTWSPLQALEKGATQEAATPHAAPIDGIKRGAN